MEISIVACVEEPMQIYGDGTSVGGYSLRVGAIYRSGTTGLASAVVIWVIIDDRIMPASRDIS